MQIMLQSKSADATSRIMVALWLSTDPAVSATVVVVVVVVADAVVVARWSIWQSAEVWNISIIVMMEIMISRREKKFADLQFVSVNLFL